MNKKVLYFLIAVAVVCVILFLYKHEENYTEMDDMIEEEDENDHEVLASGMAKFSLYLVPEIQPKLTKEARKYGGFHITLFPSQTKPANYSIVKAMQDFKMSNEPWNLMRPNIHISFKNVPSKNLRLMHTLGGQTINKLKKFLQTNASGQAHWNRPWGPAHLTLGTLKPHDQADPADFTHQTTWYVQLVLKSGKNKGWLRNERVQLFAAR
jgi:hypothetical protein